ncbi:butyrophilin subfamily 1 member A1-like isoform X2 [Carettochelys insculpta]|uniref:butyrophilin subfamily 1 member A1-like isoform X2 n=1 Tax=Carettochelys insculpta TaxID=44489 RepID=UPI003EBEE348
MCVSIYYYRCCNYFQGRQMHLVLLKAPSGVLHPVLGCPSVGRVWMRWRGRQQTLLGQGLCGKSLPCWRLPGCCLPLTHCLVCRFSSAPATTMKTVPSLPPSSSVSSALPGYLALFLALHVPRLDSAKFTVMGPDRPVVASLGGKAVLPCHLSPRISAQDMEVRWFRDKYSSVVHLYFNGQDQYREQMPAYQGRTELLKDDITNGRVSLTIHDVRLTDEGLYKCFFASAVTYEEASLELQVAGLGSDPDISVGGYQDGGIQLVCQSSGWYPKPEVLWRDLQGRPLPQASEKISQEASGLFQTEIAIVLTEESNQKVSCCVRNSHLNQERESAISLAEQFFPRVNAWIVVLGLIVGLLVVFLVVFILWIRNYCQRQRREKGKLQAELSWRCAQLYAVDMTLDPDTAHPNLVLSEDRKQVTYTDQQQDRPDNPERFRTYPVVLGARVFTGGRAYWEVEMGTKTNWTVGLCREPAIRTGKVKLTPENGYWTMWLRDGKYEACTLPPTPLPRGARPSRVGVFLDHEAGEVSFYNVTDRSHLFTFTDTFSGPLRPYFYTGYKEGDRNAAPLVICPVPAQARGNLFPGQ